MIFVLQDSKLRNYMIGTFKRFPELKKMEKIDKKKKKHIH